MRSLNRATGLNCIGVTLARISPGKESFIYHAHSNEEEWIYILSGKGIAEIDDQEYEIAPGDLLGFGLSQAPHHLRNSFEADRVYLVGGEVVKVDISPFPRQGKRAIRDGENADIVEDEALGDVWSSQSPAT